MALKAFKIFYKYMTFKNKNRSLTTKLCDPVEREMIILAAKNDKVIQEMSQLILVTIATLKKIILKNFLKDDD